MASNQHPILLEYMTSVIWLIVAVVAFVIFLIFYVSYRRVGSKKLLITTVAFFLFGVKSALLSLNLFLNIEEEVLWIAVPFVDLIIMALIIMSLYKKS